MSTPNPQSVCKNCREEIKHSDNKPHWYHVKSYGMYCDMTPSHPKITVAEPASLNAPAGTNPCRYRIGQTVFWNGQLGECSGKIIDITRPENSDYVLLLDIGDGAEMFHSVRDVWMAPAPAEHQGVQQPRTLICSRCHAEVRCDGEFKLWKHSNGGLMCEDAEAVETAPQPVAGEGPHQCVTEKGGCGAEPKSTPNGVADSRAEVTPKLEEIARLINTRFLEAVNTWLFPMDYHKKAIITQFQMDVFHILRPFITPASTGAANELKRRYEMVIEIFQDDDGIWRGSIKPISATNRGGDASDDTLTGLMDKLTRTIPRVLAAHTHVPQAATPTESVREGQACVRCAAFENALDTLVTELEGLDLAMTRLNDGEFVTGYQIKTGIWHRILGQIRGGVYPVITKSTPLNCTDKEGEIMTTHDITAPWRDWPTEDLLRKIAMPEGFVAELRKRLSSVAAKADDELLVALKQVRGLFVDPSPFYIKKLGSPITNGDQERIDLAFIAVDAAIAKAEASPSVPLLDVERTAKKMWWACQAYAWTGIEWEQLQGFERQAWMEKAERFLQNSALSSPRPAIEKK